MYDKAYPAKILLFGEYTVTKGSPALAIPFFNASGCWTKKEKYIDTSLMEFLHFLKSSDFGIHMDVQRLEKDIHSGLYFDSKIPVGFGLGSSGAIVAALYDEYVFDKKENPVKLKQELATLESHFHGNSSGIDPLVSYLKEPVLISDSQQIKSCKLPSRFPYTFFIMDSFSARNTQTWVALFQEKISLDAHFRLVADNLTNLNKNVIQSFLDDDFQSFWEFFQKISTLQFDHFREFIPSGHDSLWREGLLGESFFLKLCGAGGGGYSLGITKDLNTVLQKTSPFSPTWVSW